VDVCDGKVGTGRYRRNQILSLAGNAAIIEKYGNDGCTADQYHRNDEYFYFVGSFCQGGQDSEAAAYTPISNDRPGGL
jgi:hypothetical protein